MDYTRRVFFQIAAGGLVLAAGSRTFAQAKIKPGSQDLLLVVDGKLRATGTRETFRPEELVISEFHRFEGISDPDDMAIVYGVEARNGLRGTVVDAFGVYSDPALSALMARVPISQTA